MRTGTSGHSPAKVLVVDDEPLMCDMVENLLEEIGFQAVCAANGQEACDALEDQRFDLIITDLNMPVMDGYEFLEWMQQREDLHQVPKMVFSSTDDTLTVKKAIGLGATVMIGKPLNWAIVQNQIRLLVHNSGVERSLRIEQQRALEAANQKDIMLSLLTHELRTPLNAIIGFSELIDSQLAGDASGSPIAEYAREVAHAGWHLSKSLNDAILFSRILSGNIDLEFSTTCMIELIKNCIARIEPEAKRRNLEILPNLETEPLPVQSDRHLVSQAVMALLDNAVKFSAEGNSIGIRLRKDEDRVHLEISDTGIGMPQHIIQKFKEPFVQAENALTRSIEGLGLGLAIADRVAQLHDASFDIKSEPGKGTRVSLIFQSA